MTQNVMGESIAHLDKTRGPESMMTTTTTTEADVTGVVVGIDEMTVGTEANLLGARGTETGARVEMGVEKGKTRSEYSTLKVHSVNTYSYPRRKRDRSEDRKARKAEKKRIREEEEARQVAELSAYSATDNPFHDVNLSQQFRWHKKAEKERKQGLTLAEAQRRDALRRQEAKEELERLNRRRAQREEEQRLREEEELRMQRLQESAQMSEWLSKEGDFQLEQERKRAAIRIKEKRAKAIDFLALNLKYLNPHASQDEAEDEEDAGLEIDLDEPYKIFDVRIPGYSPVKTVPC